jgi:transposase
MLEMVRKSAPCRRLMTIPGVGAITAVTFLTTIDDPARFHRSRDVGAHLGLTPKKYASGETDGNGGISKCGDAAMRAVLYVFRHPGLGARHCEAPRPSPSGRRSRTQTCRADAPYLG